MMKVMPEHWCYVNLLEIAPINASLVDPRKDEYRGMTLIAPDHIESGSGRILDKVTAVDQGAISGKYLAKKNSIIYSKIRPYLMKAAIIFEDALCSADMYPLECTEQVIPEYLLNVLLSDRFTVFANSCSNRTGIPKINRGELAQFRFRLPPLPEQAAIADLLSTWDQAIEKTERLIVVKEKRLDWYRQQLFLSTTIESSSWKRVRLAEVLMEHGQLSTGAEEVFSVSVHKGVVNQIDHLGRAFAAKDKSKYNLVQPGDIVYTKSPTGDFPYGIIKQSLVDKNVIVSPLYGVFTPVTVYLGTIIDFYFESPVSTKNYLRPNIQKGAKNTMSITNKVFLSGSLLLPTSNEEQKRVASILNTARREIDLLKKQAKAYRKQKRGLMQKLLTGTWRVIKKGEG